MMNMVFYMSKNPDEDLEAMFPIGALSDKTGVKTVTLRAWERRHGLLKPRRTPKGHRLFSQHDVVRVRKILELLEQGVPVHRVKSILDGQSAKARLAPLRPGSMPQDEDPWRHYNEQFRRWIQKLDSRSLERTYSEITSLYSQDIVARKLILPLYNELQQQSALFPSLSAEQAFLHEFLTAKLSAGYLRNNTNLPRGHKSLLFYSGANPKDKIKTLLLANVVHVHSYEVNLLGHMTTVDSLPLVLQRVSTDALVIMDRHINMEQVTVLTDFKNIPFFVDANARDEKQQSKDSRIHWLEHDLTKASDQIDGLLTA